MSNKFLNIRIYPTDLSKLKIKILLAILDCETYADFEKAYDVIMNDVKLSGELFFIKHTIQLLKLPNNPDASIHDDLKSLYAQRDNFELTIQKER